MQTREQARQWLQNNFGLAEHARNIMTVTAEVGPLLADVMISEHNDRNRPIRRAKVEVIAADIREDRWKHTSQPISFSRERRLNNGQHRLHAIVLSGKSVRLQVAFGEDDDAFDVIDTNSSPRAGGDVVALLGYKNSPRVYATARLVHLIEANRPTANMPLPNHKIAPFMDAHPGLYEWCNTGDSIRKAKKTINGSSAAAALYLIEKNTSHKKKMDVFIDALRTGANLDIKHPVLVFRSLLDAGVIEAGYREGTSKACCQTLSMLKTWNAFVSDQVGRRKSIVWTKDEGIPDIK